MAKKKRVNKDRLFSQSIVIVAVVIILFFASLMVYDYAGKTGMAISWQSLLDQYCKNYPSMSICKGLTLPNQNIQNVGGSIGPGTDCVDSDASTDDSQYFGKGSVTFKDSQGRQNTLYDQCVMGATVGRTGGSIYDQHDTLSERVCITTRRSTKLHDVQMPRNMHGWSMRLCRTNLRQRNNRRQ